jgi:hypothetical protein
MHDPHGRQHPAASPRIQGGVPNRVPVPARFPLGGAGADGYTAADMTRNSIELAAKAFIIALSIVFLITVWKVLGMMGIL